MGSLAITHRGGGSLFVGLMSTSGAVIGAAAVVDQGATFATMISALSAGRIKSLNADCGAGDDPLTIGGDTEKTALFTKGKVTIDLGGDAGDVFNDNNSLGEYKKAPVIF